MVDGLGRIVKYFVCMMFIHFYLFFPMQFDCWRVYDAQHNKHYYAAGRLASLAPHAAALWYLYRWPIAPRPLLVSVARRTKHGRTLLLFVLDADRQN